MIRSLKDVSLHVNTVHSDVLRSTVIEYLKTSSVALSERKKLMSMIKSKKDKSFEIFPGHKIKHTVLDLLIQRRLYDAATSVFHFVEVAGIDSPKEVRTKLLETLKSFGYIFTPEDERNTRIWAALDAVTLAAGYRPTPARYKKNSGREGFYTRLRRIKEFSHYDRQSMIVLARNSITKLDTYAGRALD